MIRSFVHLALQASLIAACGSEGVGDSAERNPERDFADRGEDSDAGSRRNIADAQAGDGGASSECGVHTASATARSARSQGFEGSEDAYFALYDVPCEGADDCIGPCEEAGGTEDMCSSTECVDQLEDLSNCLPPPVWRNLENILFEGSTVLDSAEITLVDTPYHDVLLTEEFKFEIPSDAIIDGIVAEVRRAGSERVAEEQIRLHLDSELAPSERAEPMVWSEDLEWVQYGDENDTWGRGWSTEEINSDGFGLAMALVYTRGAGNARAYVDQVKLTVHYHVECE